MPLRFLEHVARRMSTVSIGRGEHILSFGGPLLAGGSSVSIVGSGGFEPYTDTFRLFDFLTALAGTAVTSLVLTYLMQVDTALLRRTTSAAWRSTCAGKHLGCAARQARRRPRRHAGTD
jgi:hypothetical protein